MHPLCLRGARTHTLKGVDLTLFPYQVVAITGPSGSGKSSLALDTLYAEGQRRFVESFSPYARQFLERLDRPPLDRLDPIAAGIAALRKTVVKSSRSTLATLADLEPYLAALFSCESVPLCPDCNMEVCSTSPAEAAATLVQSNPGGKVLVSYPSPIESSEEFLELRETLARDGYRRLWIDEQVREIDSVRPSEALAAGARLAVLVDRITLDTRDERRVQEAIETAWRRGRGRADLHTLDSPRDQEAPPGSSRPVVQGLACPGCGHLVELPRPSLFSYNSPLGACSACHGFGYALRIAWSKVIPDGSKTLAQGAIRPWNSASTTRERESLYDFCLRTGIPMDVPWDALPEAQRHAILEGEPEKTRGRFSGLRAWFAWLETKTYKMPVRVFLARYRESAPCESCGGARLQERSLRYRVDGLNLAAWHAQTVTEARQRVHKLTVRSPQGPRVQAELSARLTLLERVGLGYLTLDRLARTLSGGEVQRASLTTALSASLTGTLFVLDEPTVGLHAADIAPLTEILRELARKGNVVLVIEHDPTLVRAADRMLELGPGAGAQGGRVLFDGVPSDVAGRLDLPTGRAWGRAPEGRTPRTPQGAVHLRGVRTHNLQSLDVSFPLGVVCCVTGPSGSGKSTLAVEVLFRALAQRLGLLEEGEPGHHDALEGAEGVSRVVLVDAAPLGRTARGNPATYTKAWDRLRACLAAEEAAVRARFTASHFSFNVAKGRCTACAGEGYETVEMQFLANVSLLCPACQGKRFREEVLAVRYRGLNAHELLSLTVEEVLARCSPPEAPDRALHRALDPLMRLGLGYLPLGQPLSTLSDGEAKRVKLARALSERCDGTLFVLDEPSAGLHAEDTNAVIRSLYALTAAGGSVVVVEHDLDLIAASDWVIDLGPEAGPGGGRVVAEGPPEQIARSGTKTGLALQQHRLQQGAWTEKRPQQVYPQEVPDEPVLRVEEAWEHNLKGVSCTIPHGTLCVVTGPSGSGKSSLVFDVIFAEGQRRFLETLSPYARQFLPTLPRPEVGSVQGIPPSIALEQRTSRAGGNSTVATVTEIAHALRLLYAKVGVLHCPTCEGAVTPSSAEEVWQHLQRRAGTCSTLYAPAVRGRKGIYLDLFAEAVRAGCTKARIDGVLCPLDPPPKLAKTKEHTIDLVVFWGDFALLDRATLSRALQWGGGSVRVAHGEPSEIAISLEEVLSTARACSVCGTGFPELDPRWFSFNTKQGQCPRCEGTGQQGEQDASTAPPCPVCEGTRLAPIPRRVRIGGETYPSFLQRSVAEALHTARGWRFAGRDAVLAEGPQAELVRRLVCTDQIGLGYLGLDRPAASLSGGEMQRLRLSAQLGSGLTGALYVLDEPTLGLHPRDTQTLLANLRALVATGSTVLVVEHDLETIRAADHLLDLGPVGGAGGGYLVAQGPPAQVLADPQSPTGKACAESGKRQYTPRPTAERWMELTGACAHNLKGDTLRIPVGRLCVVAGVSGSGKSTLIHRVLYPALRQRLGLVTDPPGAFDALHGVEHTTRVMAVDQAPLGRSHRSTPATFLGVWDELRKLFAGLPEAQARGYTAARFSFNAAAGGRCATCNGQGILVSEMAFLPDVVSVCTACNGLRFEPATLSVRYGGLSVGEVLQLTAEEASQRFAHHPRIAQPLATLCDLGIGYLKIGQGSHTLSGGEAQRLKLAAELNLRGGASSLYFLDEPTTGLHVSDVHRLLTVLNRLVDRGDTLVVIEHQPDVIASADWVVELGPEAGNAGGHIVFAGPPQDLPHANTPTGRWFAAQAHKGATS